ncbi:hypothetical protein TNCV_579181 [Trichonephila clavipes]|nr:hypothetical protein TNCV_579181 [Trichonephila clavipes]
MLPEAKVFQELTAEEYLHITKTMKGLGSNPREGMVPILQGATLGSRKTGGRPSDPPQGVLPQNWSGEEP